MKTRSTISLPVGFLTDPNIPLQVRLLALMAAHCPNENFTGADKLAAALGVEAKDPAAAVREYRHRLKLDGLLVEVGKRGRSTVYQVNIKDPTQEQLDALNEAVGEEIFVANYAEQKKYEEIPEKDLNGILRGWNWLPAHAFRDVFPESRPPDIATCKYL